MITESSDPVTFNFIELFSDSTFCTFPILSKRVAGGASLNSISIVLTAFDFNTSSSSSTINSPSFINPTVSATLSISEKI